MGGAAKEVRSQRVFCVLVSRIARVLRRGNRNRLMRVIGQRVLPEESFCCSAMVQLRRTLNWFNRFLVRDVCGLKATDAACYMMRRWRRGTVGAGNFDVKLRHQRSRAESLYSPEGLSFASHADIASV